MIYDLENSENEETLDISALGTIYGVADLTAGSDASKLAGPSVVLSEFSFVFLPWSEQA